MRSTKQVFTDIYNGNEWGGRESKSGTGSDLLQTKIITNELPNIFKEFGILSILDIPCGDFYWMKNVDISNVSYIGADIVPELVKSNTTLYKTESIHFDILDLIKDKLPKADMILCRDCLVHLSNDDVFCALDNICNSQSRYLLTTTFYERDENDDISTGDWRTLNLERKPFFLPKPIKVVNEGCTEAQGIYADKALGLWEISEIRKILKSLKS